MDEQIVRAFYCGVATGRWWEQFIARFGREPTEAEVKAFMNDVIGIKVVPLMKEAMA